VGFSQILSKIRQLQYKNPDKQNQKVSKFKLDQLSTHYRLRVIAYFQTRTYETR